MGCEVFGKCVTIPKVGESGTDGRLMICKTTTVTGSYDQPHFLFHVSLFSSCSPLLQERIFEGASIRDVVRCKR